ncbi:hypothetical protein E8E14_010175 [Neopestalotiopsis sp. 37M]|nr:hypothetical protein E8E14_010175 [Neopestalotiopsis sp. 37M]
MSVTIASLCDHCIKLFQQPISVDEGEKVLLRYEDVLTISSRLWCRLCAIIDAKILSRRFDQEGHICYDFYDSKQGLWVRISARGGTTALEPSIDLDLKDPGELDGTKWQECIPDTTKSASSFQFCIDKLENCLQNHTACRTKTISRHLANNPPSRLVYVAGPDLGKVYLRTTETFQNEGTPSNSIPYLTLSHCWGKLDLLSLTKSTFGDLTDGIAFANLPKTFRDAVQVTRKLGFEYLWIDSLCIFQDNLDDWNHEASKMCEVYANAVCNIAATGAADSTQGLFFTHSQVVDCSFMVDVCWPKNTVKESTQLDRYLVLFSKQWKESVEKQSLNRRAWVIQERMLSKRVISFARDQLFWECLELRANEAFPNGTPSDNGASVYWMYDKFFMKDILYGLSPAPCESEIARPISWESECWNRYMFNGWREFLVSYTRCGLTKPADKLVAIRGVAEAFGRCMQLDFLEDFVAGLWLPQLGWELCWTVMNLHRTSMATARWRAPSWSWASIESQVHPSNIRHHQNCNHIVEEYSLVGIARRLDWSGKMSAGALHLRGKLIPAMCTIEADHGGRDGRVMGKCMSIDYGNGQWTRWEADRRFIHIDIDTTLGGNKPGDERADDNADEDYSDDEEESIMQALIIVSNESSEGGFVRVGLLIIGHKFVDEYLKISQLLVEHEIVLA